jgi:hypothetical protein
MIKSDKEIESEFNRISALTNVTDETLLKNCRESIAFKNIQNDIRLQMLTVAWMDYLFSVANESTFTSPILENSVSAWIAFEKYARTVAVEQMKKLTVENFEGKLIRTMKPTKNHGGYAVYTGTMGNERIYNNGEIRVHGRRNHNITFCVTFLFSQKNLMKNKHN